MKKYENNIPVWLIIFFGFFILCGRILIFLGFGAQLKPSYDITGFHQTIGHFTHYLPAPSSTDKPAYFLVYSYCVDGKNYTATTDRSIGVIPREGSSTKIKFNPTDPSCRVIQSINQNHMMIFVGIIFTAIPGFLLYTIFRSYNPAEKSGRLNITGFFVNAVLIFIAFSGIYITVGTADPEEIIRFYKNHFSFSMLIPLFMILTGLIGCIGSVKGQSKSE